MKFFDVEFRQCALTETDWARLLESDLLCSASCSDDDDVFLAKGYELPSFPNCKFIVNTYRGFPPDTHRNFILGPDQVVPFNSKHIVDGALPRLFGAYLTDDTVIHHAALAMYAASPRGQRVCAEATVDEIKTAFGCDDRPLSVMRSDKGWRARGYRTTRARLAIRYEVDILPDGSVDVSTRTSEVSNVTLPGRAPLII